MATDTAFVQGPNDRQEADALVDSLIHNLNRNSEAIRGSIRYWEKAQCGLFASALKSSYHYDHGHVLGITLRSMANAAIIREHALATRKA